MQITYIKILRKTSYWKSQYTYKTNIAYFKISEFPMENMNMSKQF